MIKIVYRALGVAAVAGACTLTTAVPASANFVGGNNLGVIQALAQNVGTNNGPQQSSSNHGSNNGDTAQQGIAENQNTDIIKNIPIADNIAAIV